MMEITGGCRTGDLNIIHINGRDRENVVYIGMNIGDIIIITTRSHAACDPYRRRT
jgi:hypothetical protein